MNEIQHELYAELNDDGFPIGDMPTDPEGCSWEEWNYFYGRPRVETDRDEVDPSELPF